MAGPALSNTYPRRATPLRLRPPGWGDARQRPRPGAGRPGARIPFQHPAYDHPQPLHRRRSGLGPHADLRKLLADRGIRLLEPSPRTRVRQVFQPLTDRNEAACCIRVLDRRKGSHGSLQSDPIRIREGREALYAVHQQVGNVESLMPGGGDRTSIAAMVEWSGMRRVSIR